MLVLCMLVTISFTLYNSWKEKITKRHMLSFIFKSLLQGTRLILVLLHYAIVRKREKLYNDMLCFIFKSFFQLGT